MSWTTTGVKMENNEPAGFEFHNWGERNLQTALQWCEMYAKKGYVVTLYHKTDGAKSKSK